ncbi:hypothetical protein GG804_03950 [Sphingomonas histidinilytica]|uniref:Uncharacterized protein n=1 Tax=Rhizorhabdus histidinilytica TaxID=439228 RepID=A0A1T5FYZ8_9SPHN|nr:hypothetical protein [Rhizorhabdus histidinilytica]MBO9375910.1 hypothetical protein [Rhizorhabdus histidinilytica]SKC01342.1 hypothetical protein SAMN06295920_11165 [Rhizorhabdus histidinilytica]
MVPRMAARSGAALLLALVPAGARAVPLDGYVRRLEYAAVVGDLNARLLATPSATRTLEGWCRAHRLADRPAIVADRIAGTDKPISAEQRARLGIGPDEPVRYRHVRLRCGNRVLSEADNWYVPSRLTAEMNAQLDGGDMPFGTVVAPLGIARRTVSAEQLWRPLAEGWEMFRDVEAADRSVPPVPAELIRHRAIVVDRTGQPIAEVAETYGAALLDFMGAR